MANSCSPTVDMVQAYEKSSAYIKGFAQGLKMHKTINALAIATRFHEGQKRKTGQPYIVHPLKVASHLISLGVVGNALYTWDVTPEERRKIHKQEDVMLAASLLHDVVEDCDLPLNGRELIEEYGLSEEVLDLVLILTKVKGIDAKNYYDGIQKNPYALVIKLSDRCNNCSTLLSFSPDRMRRYIEETHAYIYPLCTYGKLHYPQYSNAITAMKYQIAALCDTCEHFLNNFVPKETDTVEGKQTE